MEETKGILPTWLSPVQINIIPVNNEYHLEYAKELKDKLNEYFRVELDSRDEKLSYKMRESQIKKIPFTVILGQKEVDEKTISYRKFGTQDTITLSQDDFVDMVNCVIKNKE